MNFNRLKKKRNQRSFRTNRFDEVFRVYNENKGDWVFLRAISTGILDQDNRVTHVNGVLIDVTAKKLAEQELKNRERELRVKARSLQDANTALNVLLEKREKDRREFEECFVWNMKRTIFPLIDKIGKNNLDNVQKSLLEAVKSNLGEIMSSFSRTITSSYIGLTPNEIQVALLVKQGHKTKEIADMLGLSYKTIESHREKIREKFGIKNKGVNLRTYLLTLE